MSKADEVRAEALRRKERRAQAADEKARPAAAPVRVRAVRRTVDLAPQQHKALSRWCDDAAEELGATRVTGQDVLTILVTRLLDDDELSQAVRQDLADEFHQRQHTRSAAHK